MLRKELTLLYHKDSYKVKQARLTGFMVDDEDVFRVLRTKPRSDGAVEITIRPISKEELVGLLELFGDLNNGKII